MTRSTLYSILAVGLVIGPSAAAVADPLDLDLTLGGSGTVTTDLKLGEPWSHDSANAVAVQADGKIVVVGARQTSGIDVVVARYNPAGTPDLSFGTGGQVVTDLGSDETATDVAILADGRIVVAGGAGPPSNQDVLVIRYLPNGDLDPSFAGTGWVTTDLGSYEFAYAVAVQSDGKVVVAGIHQPVMGVSSDTLLVRYLADGSIDPGFGSSGVVTTDFGGRWDIGWDMDIQNDGKIVLVGSSWGPGFNPVFGILARYQTNGGLDFTFNGGISPQICLLVECGKITSNLGGGSYDYGVALALRAEDGTEDGRIVVSGQFGVARYSSDGSLDTSFSGDGINDSFIHTGDGVAIRSDGRVVTVGRSGGDFNAALYASNGSLADNCTANGQTATDFFGFADDSYAVTIQPDGKIVAAGKADNGVDGDLAVARYEGGPCTPQIDVAKILRYFVAYNAFVHPQDPVGPPWPGAALSLFQELALGDVTQLTVAAHRAPGPGGATSTYLSYEVNALGADTQFGEGESLLVETAIGDYAVRLGGLEQIMVPSTISQRNQRSQRSVDTTRLAPFYQCYRAAGVGRRTSNHLKLRDPLGKRLGVQPGDPIQLCEASDQTERTQDHPDWLLCLDSSFHGGNRAARLTPRVGNVLANATLRLERPTSLCVEASVEVPRIVGHE